MQAPATGAQPAIGPPRPPVIGDTRSRGYGMACPSAWVVPTVPRAREWNCGLGRLRDIGSRDDDIAKMLTVQVWGSGEEVVDVISSVLNVLGLRGIETGSGGFFDPVTALAGFRGWKRYRDTAVTRTTEGRPRERRGHPAFGAGDRRCSGARVRGHASGEAGQPACACCSSRRASMRDSPSGDQLHHIRRGAPSE